MECPIEQRSRYHYRGRFAPSPSGFLHFGSLIAALASFLDAKANNGLWLVRIEDIDPPREQMGASADILKTLDAYGLHWDEEVLYQSKQSALYQEVLAYLKEQKLSYACQCTRAEIKKTGGIYQGQCKTLNLVETNNAIRLINKFGISKYQDLIQGNVQCDKALAQEDFIIHRKDGLFAYQLAVTVDDIFQNISHVVRGCDLLEPTARQLTFFATLNCLAPQYAHVPLAVNSAGYKLSKQNKATAIDVKSPQTALVAALNFLGQQPPSELEAESKEAIITWAIKNWHLNKVPKQQQIIL